MNFTQAQDRYITADYLLKNQFTGGDYAREETLTRVERYAGWTLPNIFPDDPLNEYDEMQNDYQSTGAQAVTNLANKIMMALFQPSRPFFRMNLSQTQKTEIIEETDMNEAQIDAVLAEQERAAMRELDKKNGRVVMNDVVQHLIIAGNSLLYMPEEGKMQNYSLRDFTIKRDLRGDLVKVIIRETKAVVALSEELAAIAMSEGYGEEDDVSLYTCIQRINEKQYIVWQELEDVCHCHKKVGLYNKDNLPWIPLTWNLTRNKDYGTGLVENYSGDFHTLSTLAEASLDYVTILTDVKNLVDPTGMTNVREITESPSGAYVHGREEDLYVHTPQVSNNASFIENKEDKVERRIAAAFLLNTSVTRQAERVTAEEIRMQAQELEGSLGGVYSRLALELQHPLAVRLLAKLHPMFKDIEPIIVTGLESLSRNSELDRMRLFFQDLLSLSEVPEQVADRIDYGNLIAVLGAGHGVDFGKILLPEDVVKANQQAKAQAQAQAAGMEAGAVAQAENQGPQ